MTVIEEITDTFKDIEIGTEFSSNEIKRMVFLKFGRTTGSVIPTDYCYNRFNNGIDFEKHLKIFEYVSRGKFRYLGKNYPYSGKVYHKPKEKCEICIGEYIKGKFKEIK